MKRIGLWLILLFWSGVGVAQDGLTALARLEPGSIIRDAGDGVEVTLQLSQAVPYRVYQLADPWRMVFEFSEVEFSPISHGSLDQSDAVLSLRSGAVRPGWSRLVMELRSPMKLDAVQQDTRADLGAVLSARLAPEDEAGFRENARLPDDLRRQPVQQPPIIRDTTDGPLRIMIDPGHGGIDPGAEAGEVVEAELMLSYARALKEALVRTERFEVEMTRNDDVFVPLETRVSMAHAFRADLWIVFWRQKCRPLG